MHTTCNLLRLSIKHLNHALKTRYVLLYQKKVFYWSLSNIFWFFNEMPRNLMISGHLRFSFFPRCGTFVQRRSEENEIQAHSRQSHSLSKTTFSTSWADCKLRNLLFFFIQAFYVGEDIIFPHEIYGNINNNEPAIRNIRVPEVKIIFKISCISICILI